MLISATVLSFPASAEEKVFDEDTLKALYSYKFALFTDWPEVKFNSGNSTFEFCVIGRNPFGQPAMEAIQNKPVKDKTLQIEVYENGVLSDESLQSCHVVYVSSSEAQRFPALLNALQPYPILTISDIPGFSAYGGMVTFIKTGDHVQFQLNPDAFKQAELSISSKIIELATLVKTTK